MRRAEAKAAARKTERRVDWHTYFMNIARQVASRSTCDRKHVGAVIVRDKTILSTGYNGSIRGMPHCDDVGHDLEGGHCVATIHAEANAILQAAKNGVGVDGSEIYTTASPCWNCFKLIANAGVRRIYYGEFYRDERSQDGVSRAPEQRRERLADVVVLGKDQDARRRHQSGGACESPPPSAAAARSTSSIPSRRATSRLFWSR